MGEKLGKILGLIGAVVLGMGSKTPSQAADTVILRSQDTRHTIALEELHTLAATGNISPGLQPVAQILSQTQRDAILVALRANFPIDEAELSTFLNSEMGGRVLDAIASLTPQADLVQRFRLRLGLSQGARNPKGLSLLSFIAAYPQPSLEINLDRAFQVAEAFNQDFWRTQAFMSATAPQINGGNANFTPPFDPTKLGSQRVQTISFNLQDQKRDRRIPVLVYYSPGSSASKPLIIFSHGLFSVNREMTYLARFLASYGYVIAIPEHPGSNGSHLEMVTKLQRPVLNPEELLQRPRDLSFVLDRLANLNQRHPQLRSKLATNKVLVLGYSVGGSTALALAGAEFQLEQAKAWCPGRNILISNLGLWAQCHGSRLPENRYSLRDERIKGAIAFAPVTSLLFGETGLSKIAVPTLIATATADKTAPALREQIAGFLQIPQPKWLAGIIGGTHLSFKDPSTTMDQAGQADTLYTGGEVVGDRSLEVREYVKALTLAMASQLTDESQKYAFILTPAYAQWASTPRFPFRLVQNISPQGETLIKDYLQ